MESLQSLLIISLLNTYQIVIHRVINIVMNKIVNNYSPKTTAIGCLEQEEKDCIGVPTTIETQILH